MKKLEAMLKEFQSIHDECEWIEFKVNNFKPETIGEYISALSNSACLNDQKFGYLVFGIEDNTHRLVGTTFRPKQIKIGNEELENWLSHQLFPRIDFTFHEVEYNDAHFVIIRIDAATRQPISFNKEEYIRVGSTKKKLREHPEKERKLWSKSNEESFEQLIAQEDVNEKEILKLINYEFLFQKLNLPDTENTHVILSRLLEHKIIINNETGSYDITNLGAALFARDIRKFESLSRKAARVIVYYGDDRTQTLTQKEKEIVGRYGYAVGFEGLIDFVLDQLSIDEAIGKAFRRNIFTYPPLAIRELIANAIIHQDFSLTGVSVIIEIFKSRIEISNPGKAIIDPLRFLDHAPISRNEMLAKFMRLLGICEERGSGFDKVVFECEAYKLPAPEVLVSENYTRVILTGPMPLSKWSKNEKILATYLHACLRVASKEKMTNQSLRERFNIEERNYSVASRIIRDAIEAKLIKDDDPNNKSKKYAGYVPFWA